VKVRRRANHAPPASRLESDRAEDQPHPREVYDLFGQDAALAAAAQAIRSGRPPQGWLIAGPPGVGKATLAYRIARYLLRYGASAEGPEDLSVTKNDIVSRQVESEAYPGLLVLKRREGDRGKLQTVLNVDEVRKLESFFGLTSGAGGWRVVIVDTADDMNDQAANALLKALEEPPKRAIVLVLSHAPGRLLPTIRSRCRRLDLRSLPLPILEEALAKALPDADARARAALAEVSEGSLGLALRLAGEGGMALAQDAENLLAARGPLDVPAALSLADRVARASDGIAHFGQFLATAMSQRIRAAVAAGETRPLEREVAIWEGIVASFERADGLHLEPRQTILSTANALNSLQRPQVTKR
jgi:DNA polymerase-3 subunit delta'